MNNLKKGLIFGFSTDLLLFTLLALGLVGGITGFLNIARFMIFSGAFFSCFFYHESFLEIFFNTCGQKTFLVFLDSPFWKKYRLVFNLIILSVLIWFGLWISFVMYLLFFINGSYLENEIKKCRSENLNDE